MQWKGDTAPAPPSSQTPLSISHSPPKCQQTHGTRLEQTETPKAVLPVLPAGSDWRGPRSRGCGTVGSTLLTITHQFPTGSTDTAPSRSPWTMFVNSIGACTEWTLEQTACGTVDNDNHGNNHPLHWSRSSWSSHLSQEALHSVVCQSGTNLRLSHGPALVSCQSLRIPSLASMQHNSK